MRKFCILLTLSLIYSPLFSQGTLTINGGQLTIVGTGTIVLKNTKWVNNGTFIPGNGNVILEGDAADENSAIDGSSVSTFYNLEINKSSEGVQLLQAIQVDNELQMTSGNLDLNGFDLTLGEATGIIIGESTDSYIYGDNGGEVVKMMDLNAPNGENPGNLGASITSAADLGSTTIRRGHQPQSIGGGEGIKRYYDILPTNNDGLDATLRLTYFDHELNDLVEANLVPLRDDNGNWEFYVVTDSDATANYVETNAINSFSLWTLGEGTLKLMPVVLLEGPYIDDGLMNDGLRTSGLIPSTEPYTALGYTYTNGGGETVDPAVFTTTGENAIVDWVVLELRDKNDQNAVVYSRAALLQRDGDIVELSGDGPVSFPGVPSDDYYLIIRHRNHLGIGSANPVGLSLLGERFDLSSGFSTISGGINGVADLGNGRFGLFSGDFNRNGQVQNTDYVEMVVTIGLSGYRQGDFDLNGQVQNSDLQIKLTPNIGRGEGF